MSLSIDFVKIIFYWTHTYLELKGSQRIRYPVVYKDYPGYLHRGSYVVHFVNEEKEVTVLVSVTHP